MLAILAAMAVTVGLVLAVRGGDDADNDDGDLGGRASPVPDASHDAMLGPPWGIPVPTSAPDPTDGPEPGSPAPGADAAAAGPGGTAEREPQPEPAPHLEGDVVEVIHEVFGVNAGTALAVAYCETGGTFDPGAVGASGERGLFQIHPVHWFWMDADRLFEPAYNAQVAYELSDGGTDWSSWSCQP